MIEVVAGVAVCEGMILLTQRPTTKDFPLCWECPGGKVEGNESHHDALRREWREELGVEVRTMAQRSLWCGEIAAGDRRIFLLFYPLSFDGVPVPQERQGLGWFSADGFVKLELAPGNRMAARALLSHIRACRL